MKFNEMKILFGTNLLEKIKFFFVFLQLLVVVSVVERGQFQIDIAENNELNEGKRDEQREKRTRGPF